jgi:catechol 2,3-dioxygenase-like lactoylglutathione lyase family enzyme
MGGINFFGTRSLEATTEFYTDRLGAEVWLEQPDCTILKYDNLLVGFCDRAEAETGVTITFVVPDRAAVDSLHDELADIAREPPRENERYQIYQFFAEDPEGRTVEVQAFLHPTPPI